jgi:parvulin-like peptidyl-prolyl isomerase
VAKKQNPTEHGKHVTRRQVSRKEREHKTNRIILITVAVIVLIALGLGGYGVYATAYQPLHETVLEINGSKIDMSYYVTMLKFYLSQGGQSFSDDNSKLQLARQVLGDIERNSVLIQEAPKLGYTVDDNEVKTALSNLKLPDEQIYRDVYRGSTLQQKLLTDYFTKPYPASMEQARVQALVVESAAIAENITEQYKTGETFTILAKTHGIEQITKEKGGELGWLPKGLVGQVLGMDDAGILENNIFKMKAGDISKPLYDPNIVKGTGYWLVKVEEKTDVAAHIRIMLLGSLEEAADIQKQLTAGADFASLAKQFSQDASSVDGGDKGWINKYTSDENLVMVIDTAFTLSPNSVSQPIHDVAISTKGGYWVIRVAEIESNRPLDVDLRNKLVQDAFGKWLNEKGTAGNIKEIINDAQQIWAVNKAVKELKVAK